VVVRTVTHLGDLGAIMDGEDAGSASGREAMPFSGEPLCCHTASQLAGQQT